LQKSTTFARYFYALASIYLRKGMKNGCKK